MVCSEMLRLILGAICPPKQEAVETRVFQSVLRPGWRLPSSSAAVGKTSPLQAQTMKQWPAHSIVLAEATHIEPESQVLFARWGVIGRKEEGRKEGGREEEGEEGRKEWWEGGKGREGESGEGRRENKQPRSISLRHRFTTWHTVGTLNHF